MLYENLCTPLKKCFYIDKLYSLFQYRYPKGYYFDGEEHDFWEVVCVLDGEIEVSLDEKIYSLKKNQVMFHKPLQFHRLWAVKGTAPKLFVVSFSVIGKMNVNGVIFNLPEDGSAEIYRLLEIGSAAFEFDDIFAVAIKENARLKAQAFANRLENFLISVYAEGNLSENVVKSQKTQYFERAVAFLKTNISKKLKISTIAENVKMSESNLKKIFKDFTGTGVIDYFIKMKINRAKQMLLQGISSRECSERLGFDEQNYFSLVFKKETGLSPKNWLVLKRQENQPQ